MVCGAILVGRREPALLAGRKLQLLVYYGRIRFVAVVHDNGAYLGPLVLVALVRDEEVVRVSQVDSGRGRLPAVRPADHLVLSFAFIRGYLLIHGRLITTCRGLRGSRQRGHSSKKSRS